MKKKLMALFIAMVLMVANFTSVVHADNLTGTVKCSGSTALAPIIKQAAEDFMKIHPKVTVTVAGGGSGTGQAQSRDGIVDIGLSDTVAPADYKLTDHEVAIIPFLLISNKNAGVTNLTQQQAVDIYSGKVTNWKEVGGNDQKIILIARATSSGTRASIQQIVMGSTAFSNNAIVMDGNPSVKKAVETTPGAIGYIDLAYADSTIVSLKYEGVECTLDNVKDGKYKIASVGHAYTKGEATGVTAEFIKYFQSSTFQNRVLPLKKFVPLNKNIKLEPIKIQIKKPGTTSKPSTQKQ